MAAVVLLSIALLVLLTFSVTKRKIRLLEGIIVWCTLQILQNNSIWLFGMNMKLMELPANMRDFVAYDSIRSIIVPIVIILFLEAVSTGVFRTKIVSWLVVVSLLTGIQYFAQWMKILVLGEEWKLWMSIADWTHIVVLTYLIFVWIRRLARKEGLV
jgi:hypothetical protein